MKWTFKTGGPIVASPAIADGVVYIPSMNSYLYAIDQETGKENFGNMLGICTRCSKRWSNTCLAGTGF